MRLLAVDTLLIFFQAALQLFCYCMSIEPEDVCAEAFSRTDASFHREKLSLNGTDGCWRQGRSAVPTELLKQDSQPTLPQLPPFSSRTLDFQQPHPASALENQVNELMQRFQGIHRMLINHSQQESWTHERRRGFKVMPIDGRALTVDYTNKVSIINDIVTLVEAQQSQPNNYGIGEILQTKFLQYYLERHYGGLAYECNNLSIQEKLQEEEEREREGEKGAGSGLVISKLQGCDSLVRESNIYIEEGCGEEDVELPGQAGIDPQEEGEGECVVQVEVIRIIEVQIPVVVFKPKEVIVRYEESDLTSHINNNIDSIINRYSKPYQDFYKSQKDSTPPIPAPQIQPDATPEQTSPCETTPHTPAQSNIIASIMIDSNHRNSLRPKETEIELIYSDFPEEHNFKLPLDSYAQLQSLISHEDGSSTGRLSRPPTDRDHLIPTCEEAIMITEKGIGRSLLERIEENQRLLNEENLELKEALSLLQQQVGELQRQNTELEAQNRKLSSRLEEEIQQTEYFTAKLDEINAQILEEKVECLTHLNSAKERKIEALTLELTNTNNRIAALTNELTQAEKALQMGAEDLAKREDEVQQLSRQLLEKQAELRELEGCEDEVIEIAASAEQNLKKEIQRLQSEKSELQEEVKEYRRRLRIEGISLLYDQAAEIKGIIESREHTYKLELSDVSKRYQELINIYQEELQQIKLELAQMRDLTQTKTQQLASKQAQQLLDKVRNEKYFQEFEEIVREYDKELELKDEEILALRMRVVPEEDIAVLLSRFTSTISLLESQLNRERTEKAKITAKFMDLEEIVRSQLGKQKKEQVEAEERLIEQLSQQLEKKMEENKAIKSRLSEQSLIIAKMLQGDTATGSIKKENDRLKEINRRLKRYTLILEEQIKAVCKIDQCESHRVCVNSLMDQKNYFCQMLTREHPHLTPTPTPAYA